MRSQTKQLIFLFITLIFCLTKLSAQNNETELYQPFSPSYRPSYSDNLPEFVKMTFQANPNFNAIEAAFEEFEKEEKAEKAKKRKNTEGGQNRSVNTEEENENIYEVYYERWKRAYKPFVQADGSILLPTVAEYKRKIHTENKENQQRVAARNSVANWTCIGPKETFWLKNDRTTQTACPWQVNIYAFDISKSNPSVLFACPETGGVFKTIDKGLNWTACGSSTFNFGGTGGAVEIHPTNPDIVYVSINSFLWKTINGGDNWVDLTNCTASGVNDIAISPADPNIVMVAADNGFFRSTDGGSNWSRPFTTACYDIEFNPTNATHVFILKSTGVNIIGTDPVMTNIEFLKSTDSGAFTSPNYTSTDMGFTTLTSGRLAVTAADGSRIYALCLSSTNPPKLLKSANEGNDWTDMNATFCTGGISDATGGQGYYDLSIAASQSNANELIFGMSSITKAVSTDGGATFTYTNLGGYCGSFPLHPDLQEAKTIMNNGVMEAWVATDGGLTYSTDFFTSTSNAFARNNGIYSTDFWGYSQGWNEDVMVGGRYHNGNTALSDSYPAGQALRLGGAEAGTGYVLHGNSRQTVFSDIGSIKLPLNFSDYGTWGSYGKYPNEAGYGFNASSFVIHPNYYKQQFVGEGNNLWKTTDNGVTFVSLKDFGSPVRRFEVSRSNPSVIYVATDAGFNKSPDGGTTWSTVALPSGKSAGSLYLAINPTNDQDVWICFNNVSGSGKVYQSTNAGDAWTSKDGTVFSSFKIKNIIHTGGGVYIAADGDQGRVFYRSNSTMSWTDFSDNLPVSMNILKMLPFYRDGKLRVAGNRGVWETALESDIAPIALPTVDKPSSTCPKDTFYFEDYSILKHAGATWAWSFSSPTNPSFTPQYVSSASARNPKVIFGSVGKYTATLTVTNSAGTSTKTITDMIDVTSDGNCELSTVIGKAMFSSQNGDYLETPLISLNKDDGSNNNQITLMAWVKPNGIQSSYCSILGMTSGNVELLIRDNNKLGLSWNGDQWGWSSGLTLTSNEWAHVALVATPTDLKLYLNGKEAINTTDPVALNLATTWRIGIDRDQTGRTFKGLIDEVCLYNRALSANELREKMHLMKNPATDASLKGYYQFDETSGKVWNKALNSSTTFTGTATRAVSTAPVAVGTSQRISAATGGIKDFTSSNISFEWPLSAILPDGDIVVSELNAIPDQTPSGGTPLSNKYWIINNYGTYQTFTPLLDIKFKNLSGLSSPASNYKLYRRNFNADGATWGTTLDGGDNLASNTLTFTPAAPCVGLSSFGQFVITDDVSATPPTPSGDACVVGTVTGKSLSLTATNQSLQIQPNLSTTVTHFTTTAWIKPNGAQSGYAGIVSNGEWSAHGATNTNGLVFDYYGTKLWYRWAGVDDTWAGNSGLTVPLNEWSYVAMVVTPDSVAIYLNDQKYVRIFLPEEMVDKPTAATLTNLYVGYGHYSAYFKGEIEEVRVWNKALTQEQIREMRHLTKDNAFGSDPNFIAYFQFNEQLNGKVINKAQNVHGTLNGSAALTASTAPVGSGVSQRLNITSGGVKTFATPEVDIEFPTTGLYPNGEIVVTRLNADPNLSPTSGTPLSNKYWIVNNYGSNAAFSPLTSIKFNNLTGFATGTASNFKLYKRNANADGATWGTNIDGADDLITNNLTFTPPIPCMGISSFGQFSITNDAATAAPLAATAECNVSTIIGKAMSISNNSEYFRTSVINLNKNDGTNNNEITLMAWIRPNYTANVNGVQNSYASLISTGVGTQMNLRDNNELGFHWQGTSAWQFSSGLTVPPNEWSHVALVATSADATLYLNGKPKVRTTALTALDFSNIQWYVGYDPFSSTRTFKGLIDEVGLYNRALTQNEIREQMHLIKSPSAEASLKGYFQFDETSGSVWNKVSGLSSNFVNSAIRTTSTAPVAKGTSQRTSITTGGVKDFPTQHLTLEFPTSGTLPNGEIVVNELNAAPDQSPTSGTPLSSKYWIVNNYGSNSSFTALTRLSFSDLGTFAKNSPSAYNMYKRNSTKDGATWGVALDVADELVSTNNNTLTFSTGNGITSFSQFTISKEAVIAIDLLDFKANMKEKQVELTWQVANERDVKYYVIERSFDGKTFSILTQHNKGIFSTTDETPQYGVNYYRLKIIENDGRFIYSQIKNVVFEGIKNNNFKIYPNPTSDRLNIEFVAERTQTVDFELLNANGQIVYIYKLDGRQGNNRLFFNTSQFPAGLYTLKIKQDKVVSVEKIVLE